RMLGVLSSGNLDAALALAEAPARIRGYGHVKLANLAAAKRVEAALAKQLGIDAARGPAVAAALAHAAQGGLALKGIPVVASR
ncbi:MAG: hypothetical protein KGL61_17975, partial [Burkholderiales bacterium]|nr:hypothetical protein [Burkholderiales bacterium]